MLKVVGLGWEDKAGPLEDKILDVPERTMEPYPIYQVGVELFLCLILYQMYSWLILEDIKLTALDLVLFWIV